MDSQNKIVFAVELGFTFTSLTSLKLVPSIALHSLRYYLLRLLRYKFVPCYRLRSVINRLRSRYRPPRLFLLLDAALAFRGHCFPCVSPRSFRRSPLASANPYPTHTWLDAVWNPK